MAPDDHRALSDAAWSGETAKVALMLDLGFDPRAPGEGIGLGASLRVVAGFVGHGARAAAG